jgi:hypothetical protein
VGGTRTTPKFESITFGPVTYDVAIARTAQVFYVVDQISLWSSHSHRQYARWAEERHMLGDRERELLEAHKRLRAKTQGWGVLDRAFASPLEVHDASERAAREGVLDTADAEQERVVLEAFEPLLTPTLNDGRPRLEAFRDAMKERAATFGRVLTDVEAFAGTYTPVPIPLYLVFDPVPHTGGGGYNGGIAWVEIAEVPGALHTLMHETIHVIMRNRWHDIQVAASSCGTGLDGETLNEGIDYAISPGIIHDDNGDPLASAVDTARKQGKPATDDYLRDERFGLALRPLLEQALERRETLSSFLPRACDAWRAVAAEPWP